MNSFPKRIKRLAAAVVAGLGANWFLMNSDSYHGGSVLRIYAQRDAFTALGTLLAVASLVLLVMALSRTLPKSTFDRFEQFVS